MKGAAPGSQHGGGGSGSSTLALGASSRRAETQYDQILVSLEDVKILVALHGRETHWWDDDVQRRAHLCVLQRVNIELGVFFCIGGTVDEDDANMLLDTRLHPIVLALTTTKLRQVSQLVSRSVVRATFLCSPVRLSESACLRWRWRCCLWAEFCLFVVE